MAVATERNYTMKIQGKRFELVVPITETRPGNYIATNDNDGLYEVRAVRYIGSETHENIIITDQYGNEHKRNKIDLFLRQTR